jgi:hypothetical protein
MVSLLYRHLYDHEPEKLTSSILLHAEGHSCEMYLKAGAVKGLSCSPENFKRNN